MKMKKGKKLGPLAFFDIVLFTGCFFDTFPFFLYLADLATLGTVGKKHFLFLGKEGHRERKRKDQEGAKNRFGRRGP